MKNFSNKCERTKKATGEDPVADLLRTAGDHPASADEIGWREETAIVDSDAAMQALARLLGRMAARKVARSTSHPATELKGTTNV